MQVTIHKFHMLHIVHNLYVRDLHPQASEPPHVSLHYVFCMLGTPPYASCHSHIPYKFSMSGASYTQETIHTWHILHIACSAHYDPQHTLLQRAVAVCELICIHIAPIHQNKWSKTIRNPYRQPCEPPVKKWKILIFDSASCVLRSSYHSRKFFHWFLSVDYSMIFSYELWREYYLQKATWEQ